MSESAPSQALDLFAPSVLAIGGTRFAGELISALDRMVQVDHLCLMRFDCRSRPPVLESATLRGGKHVSEVQRAYVDGFFRQDPSLRVTESPQFRDGVAIVHLHRDSLPRETFSRQFYARVRLLERLSIVCLHDDRLHCLNLYRHDEAGGFATAEVEIVETFARFLAAIAVKHDNTASVRLRCRDRPGQIDTLREMLQATHKNLTRRELDVSARILVGMTSEGIALDLGVSLNSVLTYRKRAYGRLGITSQTGLFSLCLGL